MKGRGRRWAILAAATAVIAAIGMAMLLGEGTASSAKISGQVLLDTAGGAGRLVRRSIWATRRMSAPPTTMQGSGRSRLVRLQHPQGARRPHAGAPFGGAGGATCPYKSYWAVNMIVVDGDSPSSRTSPPARRRADRVERRLGRPPGRGRSGDDRRGERRRGDRGRRQQRPGARASGPRLHRPGHRVANQDTGMRWTHAALKRTIAAGAAPTSDHNYNWHDSCTRGSPTPTAARRPVRPRTRAASTSSLLATIRATARTPPALHR